uniref:HEAT repeat domain-containing protein n=1 Tax=Chamaesiphon sp. GL140_3_metabinner_50 TaxID=2970812 RepID=UPI0025E34F3C
MQVEWKKLAIELGAVNLQGTHLSLTAIETLLGEDFFIQAVEYCISLKEGWGLPEGVLKILRPLGMKHCYHIYKTSHDLEERISAAWLLKYTSDRQVLEYIPELLADPDKNIQAMVAQILDQMLFWRAIDYEDLIPFLEIAVNHSNEEVRKFAFGIVNEETIQNMTEFTEKLTDAIGKELSCWRKRLKFETIHGFDICCVPWNGRLELSFLTAQEDFDRSEAYSDEYYSRWRLNNLPCCESEIEAVRQWMERDFEKSGVSLQHLELFLSACVTTLKSSRIQKILRKYNLSQYFQITVFSPNSSLPK